jgi:hypothetical protein
MLQIFIVIKNPSPWAGLNPRPLGPVASTHYTTEASLANVNSSKNVLTSIPRLNDEQLVKCCFTLLEVMSRDLG